MNDQKKEEVQTLIDIMNEGEEDKVCLAIIDTCFAILRGRVGFRALLPAIKVIEGIHLRRTDPIAYEKLIKQLLDEAGIEQPDYQWN